jgi:hypothetical protein
VGEVMREVLIFVLQLSRRAAPEGSPAFQGRERGTITFIASLRDAERRWVHSHRGLKPPATIDRPSGTKTAEQLRQKEQIQ